MVEQATIRLHTNNLAPARGRNFVGKMVDWEDKRIAADIRLAVSELVTSATCHSDEDHIDLLVRVGPSTVRVEVWPWMPSAARGEPSPDATRMFTWRMRLVDTVSDRIGLTQVDDRPALWCEFDGPVGRGREGQLDRVVSREA